MQICMSDKPSTQTNLCPVLIFCFLVYIAPLCQLLILVLRNVKWDNVCEG
jgi:hypothetical protein